MAEATKSEQSNLFWFIPKLRFTPAAEETTSTEDAREKADVVKFSDPRPAVPPPLKLEAQDADKVTNKYLLWQVYALGGFLILQWAWGRWKERKQRGEAKDPSDDDDLPVVDDGDSNHAPSTPQG